MRTLTRWVAWLVTLACSGVTPMRWTCGACTCCVANGLMRSCVAAVLPRSHVPDIMKLMQRLMFAPDAPTDGFLNSTTVHYFTKAENLTQSSRALGWDTNDYKMNTERGCANLSPLTYTHTGYTGTELCNDPTRQLITILFTNRVYPNKTANMPEIKLARQAFNDAVLGVVGNV